MGKRIQTLVAFVAGTLVLALGLMLSTQMISAQETGATPAAQDGIDTAIALHPAHIHSGTCDQLGDVVFPLQDLQAASQVATPEASLGANAASTPVASPETDLDETTAQSATVVEASLDDILAAEHAINVHESPENIQNYIACGDLTGSPTDGQLTIELQELNGSGFVGEAMLTDNDDGTTTVHVSVFPADAGTGGTPAATPAG
ncbi:MAG TPA: hypothetical protein VGR08_12415 [Thermomicrobiales bacterium]|nr:hypothetical protein [Thermomicrobiales bacterium]